ncbi:hypothetical protein KR084_002837 [Drosophila pseudotakahashii]|nr:hypothetical protein KR084_002837 [Drosophila pseudotakahashii]
MSVSGRKTPLWLWAAVVLVICAGLGLCLQFNDNSPTVSGFMESYKNQYHSIVHNRDNYCDRSQRLGNIVQHARSHVLYQDQALDQLERALDSPSRQIIALVGSSGVGKSLTAGILRNHFPWPENVRTLSWSGSRSVRRLEGMLTQLVYCGQNLILVDNMEPEDAEYVPAINELIKGHDEIANRTEQPHLKQLTVVLVFSVNRLQPDEDFETEMETLSRLPRTHVITYDSLEAIHLVACIRREAQNAKVQLEDEQVEEIIRGSDARASGCKSIPAKVLLYGRPIAEAQETDVDYPTD